MKKVLRKMAWGVSLIVLAGLLGFGGWLVMRALEPPRQVNTNDILMDFPGVTRPETIHAEEVTLAEDTEVIGVTVDGEPRAYMLQALVPIEGHVVNDVLADRPISVTYCDLQDCVRVYTDDHSTEPLPLDVGGYHKTFHEGTMLIKRGGKRFRHDNSQRFDESGDPLPYRNWAYERTTWKAWHRKHPSSTIYVGSRINSQ